jgi:hypothetical protein
MTDEQLNLPLQEVPAQIRTGRPPDPEGARLRDELLERAFMGVVVAAASLPRAQAHNLTRRLRRTPDLESFMRKRKDGTYAVYCRLKRPD